MLSRVERDALDELLGLDIAHTVDTSDTITKHRSLAPTCLVVPAQQACIPDGENTSSLGEAGLLLYTADPLFKDGGDLGRGSLGFGGVASDLLRGVEVGCGAGLQEGKLLATWLGKGAPPSSSLHRREPPRSSIAAPMARESILGS